MAGRRSALVVANYEFQDSGLRRLRAPLHDAEALAEVLRDPAIGDFEVRTVLNAPAHEVNVAIEEFFADRGVEDLLLLHISGHGVKDEGGDLYFAAANSRLNLLGATAVSAEFVNRLMTRTRSRRVVLLLDCCYAGAFERGLSTRSDTSLHLGERLAGRGRAVITASTAMEYAFEGTHLTETATPQPSVFTGAVVEGLRTGRADTDQDGQVSLDELYEYVYDQVRSVTPNQTPSKWTFGFQGELHIARRSTPVTSPAPLPEGLDEAIGSPFVGVRTGAVHDLEQLLGGPHAGRALAARQALERLSGDDSRSVATAARAALAAGGAAQQEPVTTGTGPPGAGTTESPGPGPADPPGPGPAEPPGPATAEPVPTEPRPRAPVPGHPAVNPWRRRAVVVGAVVTGLLVLGAATWALLEGEDTPTALPSTAILVTARGSDGERLLSVQSESGEWSTLLRGESVRLPTISPDRTTIIYLRGEIGETAPRVVDADGQNDRPLFTESSGCQHSERPAWSADGSRVALVCTDAPSSLIVLRPDGTRIRTLEVGGTPVGSPTWAQVDGQDLIVFMREPSGGGPARLWSVDPDALRPRPKQLLTPPPGITESHPDAGDRGLLLLRSPDDARTGTVWVATAENGNIQEDELADLSEVQSPTWSTYGDQIAFVSSGELWVADSDGSNARQLPGLPGTPGPPAWGSR